MTGCQGKQLLLQIFFPDLARRLCHTSTANHDAGQDALP